MLLKVNVYNKELSNKPFCLRVGIVSLQISERFLAATAISSTKVPSF